MKNLVSTEKTEFMSLNNKVPKFLHTHCKIIRTREFKCLGDIIQQNAQDKTERKQEYKTK